MWSVETELPSAHKATLCNVGWLSGCGRDFQDGLLAIGTLTVLEAGDVLYQQGKATTQVFGLIEGQIDVHLTAAKNETLVYPFTAPGRWYGLADTIADVPAFGTATSATRSLAMMLPRSALLDFLDADPKRYREIISHEYALRQHIQETVTDLVTSDGLELVARRLVRMTEFEGTDLSAPMNISQFEFATAVGVSVPTVQRAFRELKKYGAIETSYGKVVVRDLKRLKDFVLTFAD